MTREMRDSLAARTDVLEKVKHLLLLPGIEMMTSRQVADYFEVDKSVIKMTYTNNRAEIDGDGTMMYSVADFRGKNFLPLKSGKPGTTLFKSEDGKMTIEVQNAGVRCFSSRAILRIAMLLRDSEVAKEVRTQLLNVVEKVAIGDAYSKGDMNALLSACMSYNTYLNRHIDALESENDLLAQGIGKWGFSKILNAMIRAYGSYAMGGNFQLAWNTFFKELYSAYGIGLKMRDPKGPTIISRLRPEEEPMALKVATAMCLRKNINLESVINEVNAKELQIGQ